MNLYTHIIILLIPLPLLGFWMWMLSNMVKNEDLSTREKNMWLWMFIFLNILTAIMYYVNVYRNRH